MLQYELIFYVICCKILLVFSYIMWKKIFLTQFFEMFYISLSYSYMFETQNLFIHQEENIMSVLEDKETVVTTQTTNPHCDSDCNGSCHNNCGCGCNCGKGSCHDNCECGCNCGKGSCNNNCDS